MADGRYITPTLNLHGRCNVVGLILIKAKNVFLKQVLKGGWEVGDGALLGKLNLYNWVSVTHDVRATIGFVIPVYSMWARTCQDN